MNLRQTFIYSILTCVVLQGQTNINPLDRSLSEYKIIFNKPFTNFAQFTLTSSNSATQTKDFILKNENLFMGIKFKQITVTECLSGVCSVSIELLESPNNEKNINTILEKYRFQKRDNKNLWESSKYSISYVDEISLLIILTNKKINDPKINNAEEAIKRFGNTVVSVLTYGQTGELLKSGSGVLTNFGIVTNHHVIENGTKVKIKDGEQLYNVNEIFKHNSLDLAMLQCEISFSLPYFNYSNRIPNNSNTYTVGQKIWAIGNPLGLDNSISEGIISGIRYDTDNKIIQITAPISHGSSGGGLFSDTGTLIGITTFSMIDGQNLNFAIPISYVGNMQKFEKISLKMNTQKMLTEMMNQVLQQDRVGNNLKAIKILREIIDKDPNYYYAWMYLGREYHEIKDFQEAIIVFEKVLTYKIKTEDKIDTFEHMMRCYFGLKNRLMAKQMFYKIKSESPDAAKRIYENFPPSIQKMMD